MNGILHLFLVVDYVALSWLYSRMPRTTTNKFCTWCNMFTAWVWVFHAWAAYASKGA